MALAATPKQIGETVRSLRRGRAWTQADLAARLGVSRSRLSEIESGQGSFTAEQFLEILRLFNVTAAAFVADVGDDEDAQLRAALARFGAHHLVVDPNTIPSEKYDDLALVIRETLFSPDPRLLTALAPVLVESIGRINLRQLLLDLRPAGMAWRLAWVCENTAAAIDQSLKEDVPRAWANRARHADVVLAEFLAGVSTLVNEEAAGEVWLDPGIRSQKTKEQVASRMSAISRRWKQVSDIQPQDFVDALRAARDADT